MNTSMNKLAAKLLAEGDLTMADLVLDLAAAGVKYEELFKTIPVRTVLARMQKDLADAQ